jgi:hypothetical protein
MWHAWERRETCTRFRWESKRERTRRRWDDGIRMYLREIGWGVWIGFDWLRIGLVGKLL